MGLGKTYSTKYLLDSNNNRGAVGQVLSTTSTGIDWVNANTVPGAGLWIENGNDIYNSNSGNVGIGTTSPLSRLTVAGGTGTTFNDGALQVVGNIAMVSTSNLNAALNRWVLRPRAAGVDGSFDIFDARFSLSRLTINNSGNVNIGSSLSSEKLEVGGTIRIRVANSSSATLLLNNTDTQLSLENTGGNMIFTTAGAAERMRIGSTGLVGIGTSFSQTRLQTNLAISGSYLGYLNGTASTFDMSANIAAVHNSPAIGTGTGAGLVLANNDKSIGAPSPIIAFSAKSASNTYNHTYAAIYGIRTATGADTNWTKGDIVLATGQGTGPIERMRILSGGDVLIGKTSNTIATSGAKIGATTGTNITRSGNEVLYLNRTTNFGKTLSIAKDGVTIGEIGTFSGVPYIGYSVGGGGGIMFNGLSIEPTAVGSSRTNNTNDVGSSTYRWKDGWFGGTVTAANFVGGSGAFLPLSAGSGFPLSGELFGTNAAGNFVIANNAVGDIYLGGGNGNTANIILQAGSEIMRVKANGTVGIGITAPGATLDVASASPTIRITNTTDPLGNGTVGSFEFFTKDSSTGGTRTVSSIICDNQSGSAVPEGELVFKTSLGGSGSPVATEKMRITSGGNVLINHTAGVSETKLYVEGSAMPADGDPVSVEDMLTLYRYGSATVWAGGASLALGRYFPTGSAPRSRLDFKLKEAPGSNTAAPETTVMTMQSNGHVGIGTTAPSSTLTLGNSTDNVAELRVLRSNTSSSTYAYIDTVGGTAQFGGTGDVRIKAGGASILRFNTNSSERMRITSGGTVGIGTTAPQNLLQVGSITNALFVGPTDWNQVARFTSTNRKTSIVIQGSGSGGSASNQGLPAIEFDPYAVDQSGRIKTAIVAIDNYYGYRKTDLAFVLDSANDLNPWGIADTKMIIKNSGDVGIGTISPDTLLHVKGGADDNESLLYVENTHSAGGTQFPAAMLTNTYGNHSFGTIAEFRIGNTAGTDRPSILFTNGVTTNNWSVGQGVYGANDNFAIGYRSAHPGVVSAWADPKIVILTSGNVGIGTTSPGSRLHVESLGAGNANGTCVYLHGDTATNFPVMRIDNATGGNATDTHGLLINNTAPGAGLRINNGSNTALIVKGDGNVGIGVTSPAVELAVEGHIRSNNDNSGVFLDIFCDGDGTGDSIIASSENNIVIRPANGFLDLRANGFGTSGSHGNLRISNSANAVQVSLNSSGDSYLNGGDVGIGTTSPSSKLEVAGYIKTSDGNKGAAAYAFTTAANTGMFRDNGALAFTIAGQQTVSINAGAMGVAGSLIVGTTGSIPSGVKFKVDGVSLIEDSPGVADFYLGSYAGTNHFRFHTNNIDTYFDMNCGNLFWRDGGSTRYTFFPATANMTVNGTITQNSDVRVKENIIEIGDCISKVQAMRGVYYNRTDFNTEATKVGVIAQEVEAVLPELIVESPEDGLKSVAYSELTAVLINAIKEQQEIIEDLKTRVKQLEINN